MKKQIKNIIAIISAIALLSSCVGDIVIDTDYDNLSENKYKAEESFYFTLDVTEEEKFYLENINGDVIIEASENTDRIVVSGKMIVKSKSLSDAEAHLIDLDVNSNKLGETISVISDFPNESKGRSYAINYHILLPANFATKVDLVNGWVQVVAMLNDIEVSSVNGDIDLDETYGNIDLELVNGNIECKHELSYNGDAYLKSTNGDIILRIQESASAEVYAQSTNGSITTNNLEFSNQNINPYSFYGVLNSGEGLITLNTTNGNILLAAY